MSSWDELLAQARVELDDDMDAMRIVQQISSYSRGELVTYGDERAPDVAAARVNEMISRRKQGEPLQYVLGSWAFRSLDLYVDYRVLIPRPETEIVAEVAINAARPVENPIVVDLGTGSGAIALAIATEVRNATVLATDESEGALIVAKANLVGIGSASTRVTLHQGSWFDALPMDLRGKVDVLVSNPPYIADDEVLPNEVRDHEPLTALFAGPKGTEDLEFILRESLDWLAPNGVVVLECAPKQVTPLSSLATELGFDVKTENDLAGRPRVVRAQRR